ncbi:MAG: NADH-quinone oxidoreductase subunit NuoK [Rhodovulum sp.]|nr:NADH-quinone oxidoreductase subunit NuoK [Rhodovulum sp.]|tara:strand:+ start:21458 stop:21757 length:300 start_codon:yes stop_codon:yes gene_type:complete
MLALYQFSSAFLFFLGLSGIAFNTRNIIILLMSVELMLAGISFSQLTLSIFLDDIVGQIFTVFILTVAAAESAIGLAILVVYHKLSGTIEVSRISLLRG